MRPLSTHVAGVEACSPFGKLVWRDELGSTNDLALELFAGCSPVPPFVVWTERQTVGRGQGTRRWWSSSGALTFSVVVVPSELGLTSALWPRVPLASAVAICRTLDPLLANSGCPISRLGVKWPNDVWWEDRKLAGILAEPARVEVGGTIREGLVVGIGLNVNNRWQETADAATAEAGEGQGGSAPQVAPAVGEGTSLVEILGSATPLEQVLSPLLQQLSVAWRELADSSSKLSAEWAARSVLAGRSITVRCGADEWSGQCSGLTEDGRLRLIEFDTNTGRQTVRIVSAGRVTVRGRRVELPGEGPNPDTTAC